MASSVLETAGGIAGSGICSSSESLTLCEAS